MTTVDSKRYWNRLISRDGAWKWDPVLQQRQPAGQDLATFRSGLGREAGAVPKLWPYYTSFVSDDDALRERLPDELVAEHAALALFGLHQQSKNRPMHQRGVGLGAAWLALRRHSKNHYSSDALDKKIAVAAASTSVAVLRTRLRGMVDQLRTVDQPLDYDRLLRDLRDWSQASRRDAVRQRWALGYRIWAPDPAAASGH